MIITKIKNDGACSSFLTNYIPKVATQVSGLNFSNVDNEA
jgi:hypothetical protein